MKSNLEPNIFNNEKDIYMDESNCSTPYVSAPSSPGRSFTPTPTTITGFYYSAPTSPMHYILTSTSPPTTTTLASATSDASSTGSFEFEFSSRFESSTTPSSPAKPDLTPPTMSSADELFLNGQIRPMKLSSLLQHPQTLPPLIDDDVPHAADVIFQRSRDMRMRSRSQHRRARSMSPLRSSTPIEWITSDDVITTTPAKQPQEDNDVIDSSCPKEGSSSSSRCSSAGRSSKRWVFLKDFLRSKSEGRSNNKFWQNLSLKEKKVKDVNVKVTNESDKSASFLRKKSPTTSSGGKGSGKGKRRSAHEMHYTANRAQAEEMRKKTYLPYRQGLLGCLGFNSKSYGALHGFARALNPVSSG